MENIDNMVLVLKKMRQEGFTFTEDEYLNGLIDKGIEEYDQLATQQEAEQEQMEQIEQSKLNNDLLKMARSSRIVR